jgi:hypothetical protein
MSATDSDLRKSLIFGATFCYGQAINQLSRLIFLGRWGQLNKVLLCTAQNFG